MKRTLSNRAVTLIVVVSLTGLLQSSCSPTERSHSERGTLLTGSEQTQAMGANLDELAPTLRLSAQEGRLLLSYVRRQGQVAPRTAEIFLTYPDSLDFVEARLGEALQVASKELIVQTPKAGVLRVVMMSTNNLNTIESGSLAYFHFNGPQQALSEVHLQMRTSYFAPAAANVGVTLSPVTPNHEDIVAPTATEE